MIDDRSWAIRHPVVETGHWYSGREIVISPKHIDRICYDASTIFVNITKKTIQAASEYRKPPPPFRDTRNFDD